MINRSLKIDDIYGQQALGSLCRQRVDYVHPALPNYEHVDIGEERADDKATTDIRVPTSVTWRQENRSSRKLTTGPAWASVSDFCPPTSYHHNSISVSDRLISNLRFAGDVDIICDNRCELQDLTKRFDDRAGAYRMGIMMNRTNNTIADITMNIEKLKECEANKE
ncbi:hypothetical protein DPMN_017553 [Dreissena polymorpha]|uniref:Uncharacterized protein n=1 Tax=Dreissena polymorpha TaxID=45954 RepID=A0A9D4NEW6_DREPO|nr:hypothetical protein DPMN_017553 [Dreissena polymorpha]